MTFRVSRRTFLSAAASAAVWPATTMSSKAGDAGLHLVIIENGASERALAEHGGDRPTLTVSERGMPVSSDASAFARVSWGALDLLSTERLADLLKEPGPVRIASASGLLASPHPKAWARLGRLVARQSSSQWVIADLAGGGSTATPASVTEGIEAFRNGLGPDAMARLVVHRAGRAIRYG